MNIPYTTDVRPDTGLTNPKLGIWLFLASEVMLFGSLFSSYALLRTGAQTWPHQSDIVSVPLATLNTVVLIASSVTMVMAWASLKSHSLSKYRLYMGLTLLCGGIFLVVKTIEYSDKFSHGLYPATSNFLGAVLHDDRASRAARDWRHDRQRLLLGTGHEDVAHGPRAFHEPHRGRRHLLALRGRGLDFPVSGAVLTVVL